MSTQLTNGSIVFGDGTTLSSATFAWTQVAGRPTNLSQYTNDLGNYAGALSISNFSVGNCGNGGNLPFGAWYWYDTGGGVYGIGTNNCNCRCNC